MKMSEKPPFKHSHAGRVLMKDGVSSSELVTEIRNEPGADGSTGGGFFVKGRVNSHLPIVFACFLVLLGALMLYPRRPSLVKTASPHDQTLYEEGADVPSVSPEQRPADQVLLQLQDKPRSEDPSTLPSEQIPSPPSALTPSDTSPAPDRVDRTTVSVQNVEEERARLAAVERKVSAMLEEIKTLARGARGRYGGNWLRNLVDNLQKQISGQPFSLMSHSTVSKVTFEVVSMKVACMFAKAGAALEDEVVRFKVALLPRVGGTTKLADILRMFTYIPIAALENPIECNDPPYDQEERWLAEVDEMEVDRRAASEGRRSDEQLVKRLLRRLSETDVQRKLTSAVVSLNSALIAYGEAIAEASSFLLSAQKEFLWLDRTTLSACVALRDVLELSRSVRRQEIMTYSRIAGGIWPQLYKQRSTLHELCLRREVAFDFFVYRSLHVPLPRDLVNMFAIKLPFREQQRPTFIDRLEALIKWGGMLMEEMDKDTTVAAPASVFHFDFDGLLSRPFSLTWKRLGYRDRELILQTNVRILKKEDRKHHFAEAVQQMTRRGRQPLKSCPADWPPLPTETPAGEMTVKSREKQCAANRLKDRLQLESDMADAKAMLIESQRELQRKFADQVEADAQVRARRKAERVRSLLEKAKSVKPTVGQHNGSQ